MPRKVFLIVGIILLVSGFLLFYVANRIDYDSVTTYNEIADFSNPNVTGFYLFDFGNLTAYLLKPSQIMMQPNDYLTVDYGNYGHVPTNGTVYIVLMSRVHPMQVLEYFPNSESVGTSLYGNLDYRNGPNYDMPVMVLLATKNLQNTSSATMTLHHYERPNWMLFGGGAVLSSLAMIPIFKSRKQA
jgi:hypothetical protein